jgi:hypothetical protein
MGSVLSVFSLGFLFTAVMLFCMGHWLIATLEIVLLYGLLRLFDE